MIALHMTSLQAHQVNATQPVNPSIRRRQLTGECFFVFFFSHLFDAFTHGLTESAEFAIWQMHG